MPYSGPNDDNLPDNVKELPEKKRAQWVAIWNKTYKNCGTGKECEQRAFKAANGMVTQQTYECECPKCGHTMETDEHCRDVKCPECGATMRRADRPGAGTNELRIICNGTVGTVRREMLDGREYLVAPAIAIRPGVLNGELVAEDEVSRHPASWNGRPWVVGHPEEDGEYVSANDPRILEQQGLGYVFGAYLDDGAIKAEVWTDIAKANRSEDGREVLRRLEAGEPLEVSTAYFRDFDMETGEWGGKQYDGVARNLKPDHLAALLDGVGACSWEDGCGVPRVNEEGNMEDGDYLSTNMFGSVLNPYGTRSSKGYPGGRAGWKKAWRVMMSRGKSGTIQGTIRRASMIAAGMKPVCNIPKEQSWEDVKPRAGKCGKLEGSWKHTPADHGLKRWKKPSEANLKQEDVQLTCQDLKDIKMMCLQEIAKRHACEERANMEENERENFVQSVVRKTLETLGVKTSKGVRMNKIEEILACEDTPFTEEELEALSDESVDALAAMIAGQQEPEQEEPEPDEEPGVNEPDEEPSEDTPLSFDDQLNAALSDVGGVAGLVEIIRGIRANADANRQALIEELAANNALGMDAEQLGLLDEASLVAIARTLKPASYVGRRGGARPQTNAGKELSRPQVLLREEG